MAIGTDSDTGTVDGQMGRGKGDDGEDGRCAARPDRNGPRAIGQQQATASL